jgi:hypothetical protein
MDVHPSAHEHGVASEDIEHAVAHAMTIDDQDIEDALRRRGRGRPPIGSGPARVESVRLDPELRQALAERARRDHTTPSSSVIRTGLRKYLDTG